MNLLQTQTSDSASTQPAGPAVVIGVDNSPAGTAALLWAEAEAFRLQATLWVVRVHDDRERADLSMEAHSSTELREVRRRLFAMVADRLAWRTQRAKVVVTAVQGPLVPTLTRAARGAGVLVIGQPTTSGHLDLPEELARHCSCPVTVVGEQGEVRVDTASAGPHTNLSQEQPRLALA